MRLHRRGNGTNDNQDDQDEFLGNQADPDHFSNRQLHGTESLNRRGNALFDFLVVGELADKVLLGVFDRGSNHIGIERLGIEQIQTELILGGLGHARLDLRFNINVGVATGRNRIFSQLVVAGPEMVSDLKYLVMNITTSAENNHQHEQNADWQR